MRAACVCVRLLRSVVDWFSFPPLFLAVLSLPSSFPLPPFFSFSSLLVVVLLVCDCCRDAWTAARWHARVRSSLVSPDLSLSLCFRCFPFTLRRVLSSFPLIIRRRRRRRRHLLLLRSPASFDLCLKGDGAREAVVVMGR
eukprot:EC686839.1.p3 GENE.EC686839.1~~EC686839.1.p3  ORF type:complete len:140 (+),score=46.81 EC686839.1:137-556(+)